MDAKTGRWIKPTHPDHVLNQRPQAPEQRPQAPEQGHAVYMDDGGEEDANPHMKMSHLKKMIKDKERELHELQQQKVKLMMKQTKFIAATCKKHK
jgi:hypothetical protein